jgi:hypothetical protein
MTDKPIIFSGPMVRALLDGRKTQTRRVLCQFLPDRDPPHAGPYIAGHKVATWTDSEGTPWRYPGAKGAATGDRLWVREAWRVGAWHWNNGEIAVDYCDGPRKEWLCVDDGDMLQRLIDQSRLDVQKADAVLRDSYYEYSWPPGQSPCRWRPSIHMPRWASRLTLTVTDVRVQRLQDISAADSIAEGVECETCTAMMASACHSRGCFASIAAFQALWNSLHGLGAWDENPWVVALTFTVARGNIDAALAKETP